MANTVYKDDALTIRPRGAFAGKRIVPYRVNLGTIDTIFEVIPKQVGHTIYVVGWEGVGSEDSAVSFYSSDGIAGDVHATDDLIIPYMFGANSGRVESLDITNPKLLFNTRAGDGLFMKGSFAMWFRFYTVQG